MVIKKAVFVKSAVDKSGYINSSLPQIALCGRSNVGKSSLINFIVNQNKLAKTSNTPGRTRLINYYLINDNFYLVDLPGYGYASGSKVEVESWGKMMEDYLSSNDMVKRYLVLVDIRHLPSSDDLQFINYLNYYRLPFSVIATKTDKLSTVQIKKQITDISAELKIGINDIITVSSLTKTGKDKVLALFDEIFKM